MANPALGPRVLLRRLREVMAEPETAQTRLDRTVSLIAANMVAEVCSLYVMRPGGVLELYATEGLKREAVHASKLRVGEGLVGTIAAAAKPLNLSDAQAHRSFKYLPETGEEIYHSFLGVPILRGGLTIGVLVVQNRTARHYSEEEEEALQTTAMVLAEIVSSGELDEVAEAVEVDVAHLRSHHLTGQVLADGIALGHAVLHEPRITIVNFITDDVGREKERLEAAIAEMRNHVDSLVDRSEFAREKEYGEVLEAFRMFAYDRGWVQRIREAVDTGLTAEAAVERVQNDTRARMLRASDPFLRDRLHDLDDLAHRLLRILTGAAATAAHGKLPRDAIIVARNMGPAELLDYDRTSLRGLVVEGAAPNSHVAIVARALGVPALGQVDGLIDLVDTGDPIIIDGASGEIHVRPSAEIRRPTARKCASMPAARPAMPSCASSRRSLATVCGSGSRSMPGSSSTCRIWPIRAPTASGCFAPSCSSCWRAASRATTSRRRTIAPCSTPPAPGRWSSAPSTSARTRSCPICTGRARRTQPWGGAPCAWRSTA
jgi:phosphotransferase system, enzyme I, PtsP